MVNHKLSSVKKLLFKYLELIQYYIYTCHLQLWFYLNLRHISKSFLAP